MYVLMDGLSMYVLNPWEPAAAAPQEARPLLAEPRNKEAPFDAAVAVAGHFTVGHL